MSVSNPISNKKYYFNQWSFDPLQDQLIDLSDNTIIKIEPQVAALLSLLIENKEDVFSKEQLSEQLWPNTVVEENSVYQLLTKLRKILQDPPRQAKIIKTFPKKGYRFIAHLVDGPKASDATVDKANEKLASLATQPSFFSAKVKLFLSACLALSIAVTFSAIALYTQQGKSVPTYHYISEEITTALGLESWPAPHPTNDSLVYIKDARQLWLKKAGEDASLLIDSEHVLSNPVWDFSGERLALWQVNAEGCVITIVDQQGMLLTQSDITDCRSTGRLIWLNEEQLIVLYRNKAKSAAYQYSLTDKKFTEIPLLLQKGEHLRTAIKGWNDDIYYVVIDGDYNSRLINQRGDTHFQWSYPVKFATFDSSNQRLLINDESKHLGLYSVDINGEKQSVAQTARGIFSNITADKQGNFYATVENWQVNIRDKNDLPIFSSTSLDYLPVSNALGETAFMSRRGGFCQIYLHNDGKVAQLSQFKSYDTVKFLRWSPDLSLILTNRDNKAYIYNRKGLVQNFPLVTANLPVSFGWLTDDKFYSYDGEYLRYYQLSGQKMAEFKVDAEQMYYHVEQKTWWLFNKQQLASVQGELLNTALLTTQLDLSKQQSSKVSNIRLVQNTLYWKTKDGQQDNIWQLALNNLPPLNSEKGAIPELVKSGRLIWNYDVNANNELSLAVKENIDGNIRYYHQ
jgi:DNA-binding winged helix-turn-helix (wHTH) protein